MTHPGPLSVVLRDDTPTGRRVVLQLPCDRCNRVRPVYPNRPGELLCERCRDAALAVEAAERNRR